MTTLTTQFTLGEPQVAGPLAVFPIFGPEPRLSYRTFEEAAELGAFVKELDAGASVGDLLVANPTNVPLLIYEGEEVLGAQQNRTFDVSVLVAAGSQVRVPVSCVERGRWDSTRFGEHFRPAAHAADPTLRRAKRRAANARAAAGLEVRADQGEVWSLVDARLAAQGVESPSAAMNDLYDERGERLDPLANSVSAQEGQLGAIAQAASRVLVLDLVSRPDAFAGLLPRLARGYALDALAAAPADPDADAAESFLTTALTAHRSRLNGPGIGSPFGASEPNLVGSGLEHGSELVQLCAFPGESDTSITSGQIATPTRRRRGNDNRTRSE
jgi:hypothetical protein